MSLPEIISIHAPYKRVRPKYRKQVTAEAIISIHAPYKRVRHLGVVARGPQGPFQSTHPTRECDWLLFSFDSILHHHISIHAPYKRVRRN